MIAEKTFTGRGPRSSLTTVQSEEAPFEIERKKENWGAGSIYNLDLSKHCLIGEKKISWTVDYINPGGSDK